MELEEMPSLERQPSEDCENALETLDSNAMDNNCRLNRKRKPPNLSIPASQEQHIQNAEDINMNVEHAATNTETQPFVTLRKQVVSSLGAGAMNSPVVRRSSRLGQILEIPDVAAALVHDEGYEMLLQTRRCSFERAASRRQQTPAAVVNSQGQFLFDESTSPDADSESTSGSDTSSLQSTVEIQSDQSKRPDATRPRLEPNKVEPSNAKEVYDRIADSTRPAELFGSPVDKKPPLHVTIPSSPHPKKRTPTDSLDEDPTSEEVNTSGGKRTLLSRLRKSGLNRSPSNASLHGWESLARALARVGANPAAFSGLDMESFDLNPDLTPILKRRSHHQSNWNSLDKEPGTKPTLRKKTVSFSRLPSEASVKNSADCITLMQTGHQFVKMRSNARVYNRLYWLDEVNNCLRWEPSKKDSGKARIDVSAIREVRPGKTTELFLSSDISTHFPEECSFSIIYADGKTLDLIANSTDEASVWVTGLRCLMSGQDMEGLRMRGDARDTWLCAVFDRADINSDGYLDEEESLKLLTSLSDGIRELRIKQKLQEHVQMRGSTDHSRLSKDEFVEIFKDVATRPEIYFLLARFASRDDRLSADDLLQFLEAEQGISGVTYETCVELIESYEPSESLKGVPALGIDGFTKYLMSDECGLLDPTHLQVCQDMTQPLSHYFIASSHNTYLMEDQVSGPSSVGAYVRALLRCCRCVELDCWDGANGEPVVSHGHTPTNKIPFRQVIEAIKDSGFRNSVYPVILSLENHCSEKQQLLMASDLTTILGDQIYTEKKTEEASFLSHLPSPEDLKNRFLIRSRKLPPDCDKDVGYVIEDDEGQEVEDKIPSSPLAQANGSGGSPASLVADRKDKGLPLVRQLSDLVSICSCVSFLENFDTHQRVYGCCHTCSLNEQIAARMVDLNPDQFVMHNKKFLTRVYPSGMRYDSSNFNPQDYWNCGVQIAALNYQTPGLMMDINDGRFSMNGSCGYVLKPSVMREPMAYYSTQHNEAIPGVASKTLHLRIISGQNFPKPRGGGAKGHVIDPYVLIELFGVPTDCAEHRTRTAPNNSGESPVFDESFEFRLTLPSLALVRFVVLDDEFIGDEFIGQYTIPFDCMRPGYRHLRLRSIFDEPLEDATLFIHVAVTDSEAVAISSGGSVMTSQTNASGTLKKRSSYKKLKKTRSRKDIDYLTMRDCALPVLDELFRKADGPLRHATALRESQRWSLSYLREACGASPVASVKQCIRCLSHRLKADSMTADGSSSRHKRSWSALSADVEPQAPGESDVTDPRRRTISGDAAGARLRRQASETSQSSSDSSFAHPPVVLLRQDRRLLLELHPPYSNSEYWRKASLALDAYVSDTLAVLDNAPGCCKSLDGFCHSMEAFYEDIPKLLGGNIPSNDSDPSSGVVNGGNGAPVSKKSGKSAAKKKLSNVGDSDQKRTQVVEENLRWNHSVVKGQADLLRSCQDDASRSLNDIWEAGMLCSLASEKLKPSQSETSKNSNGLEVGEGNNRNGNNNATSPGAPQVAKYNGAKSLFGVAKHSMPPFARVRSTSSPKFRKHDRTPPDDGPYPVTPL
uniref:Phosphoinositide phospholipase C n=1 Tax=Phallusia mammillata TaxID=59560 RepID=A0A6F9DPG8_9ASCI|nr:inactive phospholipase C-like protein 1 [Phallusia mammillata]